METLKWPRCPRWLLLCIPYLGLRNGIGDHRKKTGCQASKAGSWCRGMWAQKEALNAGVRSAVGEWCLYHDDSDNGNNNYYYKSYHWSVSSRHESFYKVSLLIPATILCPYSHFADLEAEVQEGTVTCPLSQWNSWYLNTGLSEADVSALHHWVILALFKIWEMI